jgi:tRNA(His) guanylyltransferase
MNDNLGDRMKGYENVERRYLPRRLPVFMRLDGKAFHTFTRNCERPWDTTFMENMDALGLFLAKNIPTVQVIFIQSDELTLFLHPYKKLTSEPWFNNNIQKMVSVSAGYASAYFTLRYWWETITRLFLGKRNIEDLVTVFDSRVWVLPEAEVNNAFLWRQQDATRNAIQMLGQSKFSHQQLQNKSCAQIQELLWQEHGINFNDLEPYYKRGRCVVKGENGWLVDRNIPIFSQDKNYIEQWLATDE